MTQPLYRTLLSGFLLLNAFAFGFCDSASATQLQIKQVLIDGVDSIDGLDNPRQVKLSPDGSHAFVTSADDNALLILELNEQLTPVSLFKNSDNPKFKLEGASGISVIDEGNTVTVASFYDSAISLFKKREFKKRVFTKTQLEKFQFISAYSDNLAYERVFKSNIAITDEDTFGLLGAWDTTVGENETQLFAASFKSNAVSVFNIDSNSLLSFKGKVTLQGTDANSLGNPVTLAYSSSTKTLIVGGYMGNSLSILSYDEDDNLIVKQRIENRKQGITHLINPQKIILSANQNTMYVACSGSGAIVVFEYKEEQWRHLQSITHSDSGGSGLSGVGSVALSGDGKRLYAAGEMDSGLLLFNVNNNGSLIFNRTWQSNEHKVEGVTSIAATKSGNQLLLTLGKMDALYLLEVSGGK